MKPNKRQPNGEPRVHTGTLLTPETRAKLDAKAEAEGKSVSAVVSEIIEEHFNRYENGKS